jgi:hypothetical protein
MHPPRYASDEVALARLSEQAKQWNCRTVGGRARSITQQLMQTRWLLGTKAPEAPEAEVGMGYRGHNHTGPEIVHIDKRRQGSTPKSLRRWMKRRATGSKAPTAMPSTPCSVLPQ